MKLNAEIFCLFVHSIDFYLLCVEELYLLEYNAVLSSVSDISEQHIASIFRVEL
jgi:hypothetical protein